MQKFKKIYFEIGNTCNLQCTFCPVVERDGQKVSLTQAQEVFRKIKPFTERVCLHLMGEPLLHSDFPKLVELAKEEEIALEITTNGTLLNAQTSAALLQPSVHQVNFSLQSFADNYPDANPLSYFHKLLAFVDRAQVERPDLYVNFRLWNQTQTAKEDEENEQFLSLLESHYQIAINRRIDPRLTKSKNLLGRVYLHYDTRFDWPSLQSPSFGTQGTCWGTRSQIGIHADGTIVPCCLDKEAEIPLGNIFQTDLAAVLSTEKYQAIRTGFERGERVEKLCQHCQFATRFS
jgi:radical SAM protein with 4Fe4S-binding SPASM domain